MVKKRENKGITLIALVITVIILLILAGVSINMLTGQNGILNRAIEAKEQTEKLKKEESNKITLMEAMVQTAGTPVSNPSSYGNSNVQAIADGTGKYFALPYGASYVTGTVDTGVVVNIKGSEFVWVPVDNVVLDTSRSTELPISEENGILSGKTYTPMAIEVENNYRGILYEFLGKNSYLKYANNENYQGSTSEYDEPDVVNGFDGGENDTVQGKITKDKLIEEYNEMVKSVIKYKGFYVARYEAGLDKTTNELVFKDASVASNNVTTTDSSNDETKSWYGLYKKIKTFTTKDDEIVSSMIWGSQYDAMMNWMIKSKNDVGAEILKYNKTEITGNEKNDIINNIYDLYGCHREWTLERRDTGGRSKRGGYWYTGGLPAERGDYYPNNINQSYSARASIYIK